MVQKSGKGACHTGGSATSMRLVGNFDPGTPDKKRVSEAAKHIGLPHQLTGHSHKHHDGSLVLNNPLFVIKYLGEYLLSLMRGIAVVE
jgi:hypothetical protein